jgi:hypothetical protein
MTGYQTERRLFADIRESIVKFPNQVVCFLYVRKGLDLFGARFSLPLHFVKINPQGCDMV